MNTPEYQAISRNRHDLEKFLYPFFKEISARLRDNNYLTAAQHDVIVGSTSENGCSKLVEAVLESIKIDSVTSFVEFIEISKSYGNRFFRKFIEEKIEAKRKEIYRSLFECSSVASGQEYDVFISSGRDPAANLLVDEIRDHLNGEGLKVFVDRTSLQPGDSWPAEIIRAVNTCKAFVAVLTKKYVKSVYCNGELYEAQALKKPIFPVVFESDWDKEAAGKPIKEELGMTQYAFLDPGRSERLTNLLQLVDSIKRRVHVDGSISSTVIRLTDSSQLTASFDQSSSNRSRPSNTPFARELKSHGLKTEEITKLEENGIQSMEDLKGGLTEEEIKEIGLNVGERRRVRKLIDSLQSNGTTCTHHMLRDHDGQLLLLEELCGELGNQDTEREVSDYHIFQIYPHLEKWKRVAAHLGLTQADVQAIEGRARPDEELMRLYMLQEWKAKKKFYATATYEFLLKALIECNCTKSVTQVCKLLIYRS